ncbi:MAG TPA: hypothetical protein VNZ45_16050 [Bacteroidia bacterium]|nr:hypothetical protein [Bacteroidia bacterium]
MNYALAYYLGILTMRAYFKKRALAIKLVVYDTKIDFTSLAAKGMSQSIMGILNIDTISVKQSNAQKKYNVGTLILHLKFKMGQSQELYSFTRKTHNVEQAELYCEKIKGLRDAAKALVGQQA